MNTATARWLRGRRLGVRRDRGVVGRGVYQTSVPDTRIYAQIYMQSASYSRDVLLLAPFVCVPSACERVCTSLFRPHVRAPAFNAAWPYNSNVETPLTGTRIPDITFTHVIPHQFLETKAANIWWRERARCGLVDEVRASISPGPASNFLLLPFVPFPLFLLISRLASCSSGALYCE